MSKRWVVAAVGATLVAGAAVGGALLLRDGGEDGPQALRISPSGGAAGAAGLASTEAAASDRMMIAPYFREEYVLQGELPALDDDAMAWTSRAITVTAEDAARLAAALGVAGEPVLQEWGAWTVGPQDGTGPNLTVSTTGLGDWWYSDPTLGVRVACAEPGVAVDPGTVSTDPAVSGPSLIDPAVTPDCPQPEPPTDLPSDDAALAEATRLAEVVGATGEVRSVVTRDEWGVTVDRKVLLGGLEIPFWSAYRFGSGGQVEYANGFLGGFDEAGTYPRIGTAAAFAHLQEGRPFPWYATLDARAADATGGDAAVSGPAEGAGGAEGGQGSVPEITSMDPAVLPAVDPAVTDEVRVVTITGVEPVLLSVGGADGGVVLLPGYRFLSADGGQYDVLAVPEDLVVVVTPPAEPVPEPAPLPEPVVPTETTVLPVPPDGSAPVATLPGDTTGDPVVEPSVPDPAIAAAFVGLTEEEALAKAQAEGRPARVAVRDGEELPLTADFVADRINLVVTAGVVTDARFG